MSSLFGKFAKLVVRNCDNHASTAFSAPPTATVAMRQQPQPEQQAATKREPSDESSSGK
jgi:hypothetical protein